jgi:YhcH/YjgK/YiaL family protein
MIYDTLDNLSRYASLLPGLAQAAEFVRALAADAPDGRTELDGEALYAAVASYATEPAESRRFEAHRKYVDLQMLLVGEERMDVAPLPGLQTLEAYDADRDVSFHAAPAHFASLPMRPGLFALLWPHDAHRPNCCLAAPANVRKCVVKIRL